MQSEPRRRKKATFTDVGNVLNRVVSTLGLDRRLRENAFFNLYPALVGEPFASKSRPIFLDHEGSLILSVKDASAAQEFSFAKREIQRKLAAAAKGLDLQLRGIRFDLKQFEAKGATFSQDALEALVEASKAKQLTPPINPEPSEEILKNVALSSEEMSTLANLIASLQEKTLFTAQQSTNAADEHRARIIKMVERQMRIEAWRRAQDFPRCTNCSYPTAQLHTEESLCASCFYRASFQKREKDSL
jgi:hypothetical protein